MEEKYEVTIKGKAPLLMHRMSDAPEPNKKAGASYDNKALAEKALYKDKEGTICQPALHIESAMIKASTEYKMPGRGKKSYKDAFKGGVFVEPQMIPHKNSEWEMDLQNVVIQRSRIIRARPRFDKWELNFQILNIDERITKDIIKEVLTDAGRFTGIGDYRPRFGRFEVTKFEKI
jgi:hypothetical protein